MKKKLSQAEMKLRQITQTTLRDQKVKMKEMASEIDVLKEMVKSATKQAKAKDIDIQRLTKKIQRLEKLTDMSRGMMPEEGSVMAIQEENEQMETDNFNPPTQIMSYQPAKKASRAPGDLGLNPVNYANIEDEVQMELLQAQQARQFNVGASNSKTNHSSLKRMANNASYRNSKQKELEEAIELDRMLEIERRNQSHDIF